jgi:hypothetical protein
VNKRLYLWQKWTDAYWSKLDKYPELFPFLCRMYNLNLADKKSIPPARSVPTTGTLINDNNITPADIIFIPHDARENCLGIGHKILTQIHSDNPDIKSAFLQTSSNIVVSQKNSNNIPIITLPYKKNIPNIFRLLRLLIIIYSYGLKSAPVMKFLLMHPAATILNISKILIRFSQIEYLLIKLKPKLIFSPNEATTEASLVFPVAKKLGIQTAQYLHGAPAKTYAPFISDQFWVWSDLTKKMIVNHTSDPRMMNIGALEYDNINIEHSTIKQETPDTADKKLLFLSQLCGDNSWGINSLSAAAERIAQIYSCEENITIRVRPHPAWRNIEIQQIKEIFNNVPVEISPAENTLKTDVSWATHVYTASSTAIIEGLLQQKPSYLIWDNELEEIQGDPFFPEEYIIRTDKELKDSLTNPWNPETSEQIFKQAFNGTGSVMRAVKQVEKIIKK